MTEQVLATPAMQRYAAEIYRLQEDTEWVTLSDLSDYADVSLQAASRMIRRLKDDGYIVHEPYQGVHLTEEGEQIALPAIRRHRLVERFLTDIMGFDWGATHALADEFELGINDLLEDRIDELTGHPTQCPHGEPIPSKDGVMPKLNDLPLTEISEGQRGVLTRVRTHDIEKLDYFGRLGLKPGTRVEFTGCGPFEGPVRVTLLDTGADPILSHKLAAALWVRPEN